MHTLKTIQDHPHLNPLYIPTLQAREDAQRFNRSGSFMGIATAKIAVPKLVNRYLPHDGKKQAAKAFGDLAATTSTLSDGMKAHKIAMGKTYGEMSKGFADAMLANEAQTIGVLSTVSWTSNGKEKQGTVMALVPAGKLPSDVDVKVKDAKTPRDHDSYVVSVDGKAYWPRANLLSVIN